MINKYYDTDEDDCEHAAIIKIIEGMWRCARCGRGFMPEEQE